MTVAEVAAAVVAVADLEAAVALDHPAGQPDSLRSFGASLAAAVA